MGNSIYCSLIYFMSSFQLFLHSDQPLSEGEIIPFSGVCQSGGGCVLHAGHCGGFTHWLTDCWCATDDDHGNIITQSIIFSFSINNSFVYFASGTLTSRWRICMSVIAAFASFQFSGILSLGFDGNGVITVMINSPWQANDDADNQSRIIAVTLLIHQSLWRSARFFEFCNQAVSLMLELTITSARQWSPDIAATVDFDGYHHDQS